MRNKPLLISEGEKSGETKMLVVATESATEMFVTLKTQVHLEEWLRTCLHLKGVSNVAYR